MGSLALFPFLPSLWALSLFLQFFYSLIFKTYFTIQSDLFNYIIYHTLILLVKTFLLIDYVIFSQSVSSSLFNFRRWTPKLALSSLLNPNLSSSFPAVCPYISIPPHYQLIMSLCLVMEPLSHPTLQIGYFLYLMPPPLSHIQWSPHPIMLASEYFLYRFAWFHVHVTALTTPSVLHISWLITHLPTITITPTACTTLSFPASCHIQPILHMIAIFFFLKCGSGDCLFLSQIFQCLSTVYRINLTPFWMVKIFFMLAPFILPSSPPCLPDSYTLGIFGFLWTCSVLKFFLFHFSHVPFFGLFKTSSPISVCQESGYSSRSIQIPLLHKAILDSAVLPPMPAGQSSLYLFLFSSF